MKQYMLMFSLGPVQSFILQARKTRDLWIGSFLLSKLMEAAMEGIDGTFVFPGERTIKKDIPDLPNKYVALFESVEDAEKAACRSEMQIAARWYAICEEVRGRLLEGYYTAEVQAIWERQITMHQLFELYWVVVPDPGKGYGNWVRDTTLLLDARKRLRDFLPQEEPGEKSTISGEREALHGKDATRKDVRTFWHDLALARNLSAKDISSDGSERLDAIDTIKRFAPLYSPTFRGNLEHLVYPSTSSIATARFVEKLLGPTVTEEQLKEWQYCTSGVLARMPPEALPYLKDRAGKKEWILRRDGDLFFEEAFTERYLKENYRLTTLPEEQKKEPGLRLIEEPEKFLRQCLKSLDSVHQAVGTRPTPYYALVQMDGDHMGTILSNVSGATQHSNMSKALSMFARKHVPEIVQEAHPGRLVYAGGDDAVALSPLDGMLTMIDALQQRYRKTVAPVVPDVSKKIVTASMGIAIGHHFTPLSVVRRAALEAEKLAKNRYGRNAFVVTLLRRSGEQTRVGCHWEYPSLTFPPIQLFQHFYSYFVYDVFSPKSIHVLLSEVSAVLGLQIPAQRSEVRRVLVRQLNEHLDDQQLKLLIGKVDQQLSKEQKAERIAKKIASLAEQIVALAAAMDQELEIRRASGEKLHISMELREDTLRYGLVETLGWLLVMAFFAREGLEA